MTSPNVSGGEKMKEAFIEVNGIRKSYNEQLVLENMNFTVDKGEIAGLLGPNGSGKTTMIRLLNGVILPDEGEMAVDGFNPVKDGNPIRSMSGIVTEGAGLYHEMSALDNLRFFAQIYSVDQAEKRIGQLLEQFELTAHKDKLVGTYSTGMKKRLALAKALIHDPSLLFLDEPTNGLDPEGIKSVMYYLKELNKQEGTTILICSHVLHQIEDICNKYIFMDSGRVIVEGTHEEIEKQYLKDFQLKVETDLHIIGDIYYSYPFIRLNERTLIFTVPSKEAVSNLLKLILNESSVYSAEILNRDLESLYFQVRRENK